MLRLIRSVLQDEVPQTHIQGYLLLLVVSHHGDRYFRCGVVIELFV